MVQYRATQHNIYACRLLDSDPIASPPSLNNWPHTAPIAHGHLIMISLVPLLHIGIVHVHHSTVV